MTASDDTAAQGPGDALKQAREALNVSEREVADALNLPLNVIEAMEANDYDNLPPVVFARGYLRSYAKLLDLDPELIVSRFPESAAPEVTLTSETAVVEPARRWLQQAPAWLPIAALGAGAVLLIVLLVWIWPEADDGPASEADSAETLIPAEAAVSDEAGVPDEAVVRTEAIAADAASDDLALATGRQLAADEGFSAGREPDSSSADLNAEAVPAAESDALPPEPQTLPVVATERPAAVEAANTASGSQPNLPEALDTAQEVVSDPTPTGMRRITPLGDDVLSISFAADCWVDVKDLDGTGLYGDLNQAGTTLQLIGRGPFRILLGYAPGVELSYNDEVIEITRYTRNNVASLTVGR